MWIEAFRVEGGVLDGLNQQFSANLNVLIGGRGTGKSSVIELIRFCLGATSYTDVGEQHANEHALGVLGDGRITVILTNGRERIEVVRTAQDTAPESWDSFDPPLVFSQSEIETIGLQAQSRLRLIDEFIPPAQTQSGDSVISSRIGSVTAEIRSLLVEIDDIDEKTTELPKLQAQLEALKTQSAAQAKVHTEIEVYRKTLAEVTPLVAAARVRSEMIGRSADRLTGWVDDVDNLLDRRPRIEPWPAQAGGIDELREIRKREEQANNRLRSGLEEMRSIASELERKKDAAANQRIGLDNRAREIRQQIEEKQKGASALDKRVSDLTQQISVLKSLVDLRRERGDRLGRLSEQRAKLLDQQAAIRQALTTARQGVSAFLTDSLAPSVRVLVKPYSQSRSYLAALSAGLRGSGLRYAELAERIAETYSPQEIAVLAETRNSKSIASMLEISEERALRVCEALRQYAGGALFTTIVEDDISIELLDGADYKGIDFLSMGQRCTVVLPIVLQHTERMIVLDQPEDHLDNAFVVGTLVKALVTRSQGAQTIVATHNPNVPVLGNAAQVIHLDSDGSRCFVRSTGSINARRIVDAICTIMEGGREAFARRAEFYSESLPNVFKY